MNTSLPPTFSTGSAPFCQPMKDVLIGMSCALCGVTP